MTAKKRLKLRSVQVGKVAGEALREVREVKLHVAIRAGAWRARTVTVSR